MNLASPYTDVVTGARGRVLGALVQLAPRSTTVRELAGRADASPQGTLDIVNDLAASGIVDTTRSGRSVLVTLNAEHLAVGPLTEMVSLRLRLVERLTEHLSTWPGLVAAWLFGSAARGDGNRDSDLDLLLVAEDLDDPCWEQLTADLAEATQRWTGNTAQIVEHDTASLAALVATDDPLVESLRRDGIALTPDARRRLRKVA